MEILAHTQHRGFVGLVETLLGADFVELRDCDAGFVLGVVFDDVADICPRPGDGCADMIELGDVLLQVALQFIKSAIIGEVGVEGFF